MITVTHALSLTQPWASLMALDQKRIETRSWKTSYRGWIAIHASKGFPRECQALAMQQPFASALAGGGYQTVRDLPLGAVLAVVHLDDCWITRKLLASPLGELEELFGDYSAGRYGFVTSRCQRLHEPIPMKGALSIWTMPSPITLP